MLYRGWAFARAGQPALAAADLQGRASTLGQEPPQDIELRLQATTRPWLCSPASGRAPKSGVTAAQAGAFAEDSVPALLDAVTWGWNLSDELKEPDFDAIRDRADFKKLVAELEKKSVPKK